MNRFVKRFFHDHHLATGLAGALLIHGGALAFFVFAYPNNQAPVLILNPSANGNLLQLDVVDQSNETIDKPEEMIPLSDSQPTEQPVESGNYNNQAAELKNWHGQYTELSDPLEHAFSSGKGAGQSENVLSKLLEKQSPASIQPPGSKISDTGIVQLPQSDSSNHPPVYPETARKRGIEGVVILEVRITSLGMVENINLVQSSGNIQLDQAAINAVKQWQFHPAIQNGNPILSVVNLPIVFKLK